MKKKKYLIYSLIVLAWCIVAVTQLYNKAVAYQEKCNERYSWGNTVEIWEDEQ